jgi:hypothetical protein
MGRISVLKHRYHVGRYLAGEAVVESIDGLLNVIHNGTVVATHGWRPRALPPSRPLPAVVVRTTPAAGSRARPALSRLSPWWS